MKIKKNLPVDLDGSPALFLDFDGVMHPAGCHKRDYMCKTPLLSEIVRKVPGIEIIISSSWRKSLTLEKMKTFFPTDISKRIIAVTPIILPKPDKHSRYHEIQAYLKENPHEKWVAIDDNSRFFPPGCDHLIKVDGKEGMDDSIVSQINFKFKIMKSAPPTCYAMD